MTHAEVGSEIGVMVEGNLGLKGDTHGVDSESRDSEYQKVRNRALGLLARREHSAHELVRKLGRKGCTESISVSVVGDLAQLELQSDVRFTEGYIHSRISRGFGPMRIRQDLRQRGIDDSIAEDHLTHDAEYWISIAEKARHKRFKGMVPETRNAWNSQARFLAQRGFPSDLIYRVLGEQL